MGAHITLQAAKRVVVGSDLFQGRDRTDGEGKPTADACFSCVGRPLGKTVRPRGESIYNARIKQIEHPDESCLRHGQSRRDRCRRGPQPAEAEHAGCGLLVPGGLPLRLRGFEAKPES